MNSKQKIMDERKIYRSYHIQGQGLLKSVKKNCIFISSGVRINHELAKSLGGIMLRKFGDVKFTDSIITKLNEIEAEILQMGFSDNTTSFITEAEHNTDTYPGTKKKRRVDLVNTSNGDRFEFENNHRELKPDVEHCNTYTIYLKNKKEKK